MKKLSLNEMSVISADSKLGCALAIAGTLTVTAGAAFLVPGAGAALAVWLIGKAIGTAAIIEACT
jgi:hypothetical protein